MGQRDAATNNWLVMPLTRYISENLGGNQGCLVSRIRWFTGEFFFETSGMGWGAVPGERRGLVDGIHRRAGAAGCSGAGSTQPVSNGATRRVIKETLPCHPKPGVALLTRSRPSPGTSSCGVPIPSFQPGLWVLICVNRSKQRQQRGHFSDLVNRRAWSDVNGFPSCIANC